MEQWQIRLDIVVIAAAGTCFSTRSNAMSSHQNLQEHLSPRRAFIQVPQKTGYQTDVGVGSQGFKRTQHRVNCSGNLFWHKKPLYLCYALGLIPEPHTRASKRFSQDRQRGTFYIEDLTRPAGKNFLEAPQKNFHTSTSNALHLQGLNARSS